MSDKQDASHEVPFDKSSEEFKKLIREEKESRVSEPSREIVQQSASNAFKRVITAILPLAHARRSLVTDGSILSPDGASIFTSILKLKDKDKQILDHLHPKSEHWKLTRLESRVTHIIKNTADKNLIESRIDQEIRETMPWIIAASEVFLRKRKMQEAPLHSCRTNYKVTAEDMKILEELSPDPMSNKPHPRGPTLVGLPSGTPTVPKNRLGRYGTHPVPSELLADAAAEKARSDQSPQFGIIQVLGKRSNVHMKDIRSFLDKRTKSNSEPEEKAPENTTSLMVNYVASAYNAGLADAASLGSPDTSEELIRINKLKEAREKSP